MRVAIVDSNKTYCDILESRALKFKELEIDFFYSCKEFGKSDLSIYDAIISEYDLPIMKGNVLLESIQHKTDAVFSLMGNTTGWLTEEIRRTEIIKTVIDKSDPNNVLDWILHIKNVDEYKTQHDIVSLRFQYCYTALRILSLEK
jgi:hypothetical protein